MLDIYFIQACLNANVNHYLENVQNPVLLLDSYQAVYAEKMLFSVQSQGLWGTSLIMKGVLAAGLDLLKNTGHARKGRATGGCGYLTD